MQRRRLRALQLIACAALALCAASGLARAADGVLTLATTTSTENSGLLARIHPDFEAKTGIRVKVIAKGTGASLQLARDGNADVVLVHARPEEDRFVAEGWGVMRREVMHNDFVVLGPRTDPAGVRGARTAAEGFARIAGSESTFVSRGDSSGTHIKEQEIWRKTGRALESTQSTVIVRGEAQRSETLRPRGDWYLSVGQGMGKTITIATEKQGYTLADRGTYYAFALTRPPRTDLAVLFEGDPALHNPYGVIAVDPAKNRGVNFEAAVKYIEWITSPAVQKMIGEYRFQGKVLFHPSASAPHPR